MDYRILPPESLIEDGVVRLPSSKSVINRRLMLDALTDGAVPFSVTEETDQAVDIVVMRDALAAIPLGSTGTVEVNCAESGTALRFLTAYCAVNAGCTTILTGLPGLLRRPMSTLVDALRTLGADISYIGKEGHAPLRIVGKHLDGGEVTVDPSRSSQFVSALMLVAPLMTNGLLMRFSAEPVSLPYIKMTAAMMKTRGVDVEVAPLSVTIKAGKYRAVETQVEADWSAAAFWYEVVALTAGWISIGPEDGDILLPPGKSLQGDAATAEFFNCLGVTTEDSEEYEGMLAIAPSPEVFGRLDLDLQDNPDLAPALAVTACMLGVPFKFTGLQNLCLKESDRLQAIVEEMDKVGCVVEKIRDYGLEYEGKRHPIVELPEFDPRGDHRMAMALAPVSVFIPGIVVRDADCVAKSYPGYWETMRELGFTLLDPSVKIEAEEVE